MRLSWLLCCLLCGQLAALEIRGPQVTGITHNSASLIMHSSPPMMLRLECWSDDEDRHQVNNASHVHHQFHVRQLQSETRYFYRIRGDHYDSGELEFTTAARYQSQVRFCVYGHSRRQDILPSTHERLLSAVSGEQPDFILHTGNLLGGGPRSNPSLFARDWTFNFFTPLNPLMTRVPFYLCPGQHDLDFVNGDRGLQLAFPQLTGRSLYVIERGPLAMVVVALPYRLKDWRAQAQLIEQALQQCSFARWRMLCIHVPPYAAGLQNWISEDSGGLWRLLQRYRVDVVLSGRQQHYQRQYPLRINAADSHLIHAISTSLGMQPLHDRHDPLLLRANDRDLHYLRFRCSHTELQMEACDLQGRVFDQLHIDRRHNEQHLRRARALPSAVLSD